MKRDLNVSGHVNQPRVIWIRGYSSFYTQKKKRLRTNMRTCRGRLENVLCLFPFFFQRHRALWRCPTPTQPQATWALAPFAYSSIVGMEWLACGSLFYTFLDLRAGKRPTEVHRAWKVTELDSGRVGAPHVGWTERMDCRSLSVFCLDSGEPCERE
jgi:hypothetical protein